ncbi:unnamed protein product, partial [Meganyctiphanes norvegica]
EDDGIRFRGRYNQNQEDILNLENYEGTNENGITVKKLCMFKDEENDLKTTRIFYHNDKLKIENNAKVLLLVGELEVGKASLVNIMVNHIFGLDSGECKYRIRVVCDPDKNNQPDLLTIYCFPKHKSMIYDNSYALITGDNLYSASENHLHKKMLLLKDFLKKNNGVNELHAICFVVKSDLAQTDYLKYAFESIFSMFGYDIKHNIFVLTTFVNPIDEPPVLKALDELKLHYDTLFRFDHRIIKESGCVLNEHGKQNISDNLTGIFKRINEKKPCDLNLTNVVVQERNRLNTIIEQLQNKIKTGINTMSELQRKKTEAPNPASLNEVKAELKYLEELVFHKIDEAKRVFKNLNQLSVSKTNLQTRNGIIENLIKYEKNNKEVNFEDRIGTLQKIKDRNEYMENLLKA